MLQSPAAEQGAKVDQRDSGASQWGLRPMASTAGDCPRSGSCHRGCGYGLAGACVCVQCGAETSVCTKPTFVPRWSLSPGWGSCLHGLRSVWGYTASMTYISLCRAIAIEHISNLRVYLCPTPINCRALRLKPPVGGSQQISAACSADESDLHMYRWRIEHSKCTTGAPNLRRMHHRARIGHLEALG